MKNTAYILAGLTLASPLLAQGFKTSEFPYMADQANGDFNYEPIVTVGDRVPLTGDSSKEFAFAGLPDASGIYRDRITGEIILFCSHEAGQDALSTAIPGESPFRGAYVSRYVLNEDGSVASGSVAYTEVFKENVRWGDTPRQGAVSAFTRFCSGSFAGPEHGFDRPMFLTNEETFGSAQFSTITANNPNGDGLGAQSVAIFDGKMHTLPALGRVGRENTIVQPRRDAKTVVISTEDAGAPSYVYMYVGTKLRRSDSGLDKNGLTNGEVYVLCSRDQQDNEGTFNSGTLAVQWRMIPNAKDLSDDQLLTQADALGAFGFIRVEDTEFDPAAPTRNLFLATTGGSLSNRLGRLYQLTMNPVNPQADGTLTVVYNADQIVTPGGSYTGAVAGSLVAANGGSPSRLGTYTRVAGDIDAGVDFAVSIDNIAVTKDFIMIQEDRNSPADEVFAKYDRNGAIWSLDRNNGNQAKLQSTFNYGQIQARDGHGPLSAGLWESSGVIATDEFFGPGTFITFVQAHGQNGVYADAQGDLNRSIRSNIPDGNGGTLTRLQAREQYGEDGQILIMRPKQ
ncbi:alkaline phosphatase PhoX [Haloferula chungangensis]|uniref:Alkaline phosphatase PhoX n=1 Tax=Haloferula chungangensis TaxID=1048331 RepID=A0ABW2L2I6_9BACT